jgi:hypothetical protein
MQLYDESRVTYLADSFKGFEEMKTLHSTLSVTDFGKNPLSNDRVKLEQLYKSWILQLDDLVSLVDTD